MHARKMVMKNELIIFGHVYDMLVIGFGSVIRDNIR